MKNIQSYLLPTLFFLTTLGGLYIYQQTLGLQVNDLHRFEGIYQKMELKKDRTYPLKLHLQNDKNVYVLNKNSYKAWEKHRFIEQIKAGAILYLSINKKKLTALKNKQVNLIELATIKSQGTHYLTLANYNTFQKGGLVKFYLLSCLIFVAYLFFRRLKKNVITIPN